MPPYSKITKENVKGKKSGQIKKTNSPKTIYQDRFPLGKEVLLKNFH
jgi:hypothetical protein